MSITEYKIVAASSVGRLNIEASALAGNGYAPIGDVFHRGTLLCQAMGLGSYNVGSASSFMAVGGSSIDDIEKKVNSILTNDLQPISNPIVHGNSIVQVLGNVSEAGSDISWSNLPGKPAVIASGADKAAARAAIDAVTIGTTSDTAMAGNTKLFSGKYSDLTETPSTFAPVIGTTATTAMAGNKTPTTTQRGGVLQVAAPEIQVADPVDDDNLQEQFDKLTAALKSAGVFS